MISNHGFLTPVRLKHAWRCRIQATIHREKAEITAQAEKNICTLAVHTMSRSRERVFGRLATSVNLHKSFALDFKLVESLWDPFRKCYLHCPCQTLSIGTWHPKFCRLHHSVCLQGRTPRSLGFCIFMAQCPQRQEFQQRLLWQLSITFPRDSAKTFLNFLACLMLFCIVVLCRVCCL